MQIMKRIGIALSLAAFLAAPTHAQQANSTLGNSDANPDPVYVFNRICYAQVPNVIAIREMSVQLAWKAMEERELQQFKTVEDPKVLDGWDVQVGERLFRVGIQQSGLNEAQIKTFPGFENGTATSCSMVLDDQQDAKEFLPNMQKLAGRAPISQGVKEGLLETTTWAGGNDDIKVFLFAKAPPTNKGGLLAVTILQK